MVLNTCEMWSNRIKIAFFSKNLQKSPSGWGLCPQTPIASGSWGLCPQTPLWDTFEYTSLLNTSPKLDLHFPTISLRPFPLPKSWFSANGLQLQIFHSTISLSHKKFLFWKLLMTSLHVICGLGPPNQKSWLRLWFGPPPIKNPGYAYAPKPPKNYFYGSNWDEFVFYQ